MTLELSRHGELFAALVPIYFDPIMDDIKGFLSRAGEIRCAELYVVCKEYNSDEMTFVISALSNDIFLMTPDRIGEPASGETPTAFTYRMLLTAAHAAPVVVAFKLMTNESILRRFLTDRYLRGLFIAAGSIMNLSGTDEIVDVMPDMSRNSPIILSGAVAALILHNKPTFSAEIIRYMGEHWRELAPFAETIESIPGFEVKDAMHLVAGGPSALVKGAL
jgi:hypothetical protein